MFRKTVEKVSAAFRPLVVESRGSFATAVVALSNLFREVVAVLLQAVAGVQVGVFGAIGDSGEVANAEVDARRLGSGSVGCLNLVLADEVYLPSLFRLVVDGADLLQVIDLDAGTGFVFDKDVLPRFWVFFVIRTLGEADTVVFGVVTNTVLFPRHRAAWVFFVDAAALVVVVVFFAVAGRIVSVVVRGVPRIEAFSEFLQNPLTGL